MQNPNQLKEGPDGVNSLTTIMLNSFKKHADKIMFTNAHQLRSNYAATPNYHNPLTYKQVQQEAEKLGSGCLNKDLAYRANKEFRDFDINLIGVMCKNKMEWMILDLANVLYGMTMVPIAETLDVVALESILDLTKIKTLFVSQVATKNILALKNKHNLKNVVMCEDFPEEVTKNLKNAGLTVLSYKEVLEAGEANRQPLKQSEGKDIFTLSFTSGTTGIPKAVMLDHRGVSTTINALQDTSMVITEKDTHVSYLPLSHIFERVVMFAFLAKGGEVCFFGGDVLKLRDDW